MAKSTLTSKGQMTLPKDVRDQLNLRTGDRLDVYVDDKRIILTPLTLRVDDLSRILPAAKRARTIQEMNDAIRKRATRSK